MKLRNRGGWDKTNLEVNDLPILRLELLLQLRLGAIRLLLNLLLRALLLLHLVLGPSAIPPLRAVPKRRRRDGAPLRPQDGRRRPRGRGRGAEGGGVGEEYSA